jgi:hypothetical protein
MILHNEGRLIFLMEVHVTPPLDLSKGKESWRGGDLVMHKLAYKLAERGQRVVTFSEPMFPHENISYVLTTFYDDGALWTLSEPIQFPLDKTISIYPQIQPGQPLNTKFNARWFLYDDICYSTWRDTENDIYFNFSVFKTDKPTQPLRAIHYNFDELYRTNYDRRKGFCHFLYKNMPENYESILEPFNSEDISDWREQGGISYLREKLNEYEYLITFDKQTVMTYLPGLCGCKSIIYNTDEQIEWKNMTPTEYRLNYPHHKFGCAFGIEDIEWANKTIDLVPEHLKEMEKEDDKSVDNFIKFWEKKVELKI